MIRFVYRIFVCMALLSAAAACVEENLDGGVSGPEGFGPEKDGLDLVMMLDAGDFNTGLELDYGTRADGDGLEGDQNAAIQNITSLFVGVVSNETKRMVAYRIIASCDDAASDNLQDHGQQWYATKNPAWADRADPGVSGNYYKNNHWRTFVEGEGASLFPAGWGNWPERFNNLYIERTKGEADVDRRFKGTNDDRYNTDPYYKDDEHYGCWTEDSDESTGMATEQYCVGYNGFAKMDGNNGLFDKGDYDYTQFDSDGLYDSDYESMDYPIMTYRKGDVMRKSPAVVLTFKYANPMHGPVEKLTRGDYTIYAIANFRESISTVKGVDAGVFKAVDDVVPFVGDMIYMLLMEWDPNEGLPYEKYAPLITGAVNLSEIDIKDDTDGTLVSLETGEELDTPENIRSATSMLRSNKARIISSDCSEVVLVPGTNNILHLMLDRTVARVTYKVTNYSSSELMLSGFRFSENFAQAADVIFAPTHTTEERFRKEWQAAPDPSGDKAIVPFPEEGVRIPAGETVTVFDGLMYGGGGRYGKYTATDEITDGGDDLVPLGYYMTAAYQGVQPKTLKKEVPAYDVHEVTTFRKRDIGELFPGESVTIENIALKGRSGFLFYDEGASRSRMMTNSAVKDEAGFALLDRDKYESHLWTLEITMERGGYYTCKIKNSEGGYVQAPGTSGTSSFMTFTDDSGDATQFYFRKANKDTQVSFGNSGENLYIHTLNYSDIKGEGTFGVCWAGYDDAGSWLDVYDIARSSQHFDAIVEPYPVEIFDKNRGVTVPLYYLYRNDHLIVDINVSYNAKADDVVFDVETWREHDNEIEFN